MPRPTQAWYVRLWLKADGISDVPESPGLTKKLGEPPTAGGCAAVVAIIVSDMVQYRWLPSVSDGERE